MTSNVSAFDNLTLDATSGSYKTQIKRLLLGHQRYVVYLASVRCPLSLHLVDLLLYLNFSTQLLRNIIQV